jgi:dodecin
MDIVTIWAYSQKIGKINPFVLLSHHEAVRFHNIGINSKRGRRSKAMAKGSTYNIIELVGTSDTSWEEAAKLAVETAAESVRDLRVAEVIQLDMTVEDGKVKNYRAKVNISFKYQKEA